MPLFTHLEFTNSSRHIHWYDPWLHGTVGVYHLLYSFFYTCDFLVLFYVVCCNTSFTTIILCQFVSLFLMLISIINHFSFMLTFVVSIIHFHKFVTCISV